MTKTIDARGLSCPAPVLMAKEAVEKDHLDVMEVLVNNGVKLTIVDSPVLEDLAAYEKEGLTILVCGTCLTHFGLLEAKKVGLTTNMLDIVTAMQLADKVINI